jgi:TRAP-type C4-dicarboxylate transport system permease small subunit
MNLARLQRLVRRCEDGMLAAAVLLMVGLAGVQIVLRIGFDGGIVWIDPALRSLVLWIGMLGAVTASRSGQHIRIDLLTRAVPLRWSRRLQVAACGFTVAVCLLVAWHSARFVQLELAYPTVAFAGVPTWSVALVLPLAFILIAVRYGLATIALVRGHEPFDEQPPW